MNNYFKLFAICFLFTVIACGGDKDIDDSVENDLSSEYQQKIIGTWELVSRRDNSVFGSKEWYSNEKYKQTFYFYNDNTYKLVIEDATLSYHKDEQNGTYYIKKENKNNDKYLFHRDWYTYQSGFWYIEFSDNYNTLFLYNWGSNHIDLKYKRVK